MAGTGHDLSRPPPGQPGGGDTTAEGRGRPANRAARLSGTTYPIMMRRDIDREPARPERIEHRVPDDAA